jgi:hypothetical protein
MTAVPPRITQLAGYWNTLGDGAAPDRERLDPGAIKPLLPYLLLIEFEDDPFRIRYRLTGTRVDEMTGMNITGRYLDEFARGDYREAIDTIHQSYRSCRSSGRSVIQTYLWPNDGFMREIWMGLFPLRVGGEVRQCLAIEDYGELGPHPDPVSWRPALPRGR